MATGGEQGWRREGLRSEESDRREAVAVIQVEGLRVEVAGGR